MEPPPFAPQRRPGGFFGTHRRDFLHPLTPAARALQGQPVGTGNRDTGVFRGFLGVSPFFIPASRSPQAGGGILSGWGSAVPGEERTPSSTPDWGASRRYNGPDTRPGRRRAGWDGLSVWA